MWHLTLEFQQMLVLKVFKIYPCPSYTENNNIGCLVKPRTKFSCFLGSAKTLLKKKKSHTAKKKPPLTAALCNPYISSQSNTKVK